MRPKVSVCITTYNQEKFIAQAIESALMQKVDFEYEIVIGEDYSTDGTRDIVRTYAEDYPDIIIALLHPHNLGLHGKNNFIATLRACRGQYIAILEGDDYWTVPDKLQKQVDFLEIHPECSFCFHNARMTFLDRGVKDCDFFPANCKELFTIEDFFESTVPAASVLYRNGQIERLPEWFYEILTGDWALFILNAQYGKAGYIDEVMSVYRIHASGVARDRININLSAIKMFENLNVYFDFKYNNAIKERIRRHRAILATEYFTKSLREVRFCEYENALADFKKSLETDAREVVLEILRHIPGAKTIHYMLVEIRKTLSQNRKMS